jgi:ribulose-phosphate 3-epimerase
LKKNIELAPSLLSCNFGNIEKEISLAEKAGCRFIHWDVMDGHFVPNISVGVPVISCLREKSRLIFDVHLMIEEPLKFIESFSKAGSDILTFHIETVKDPLSIIEEIKKNNIKAGIALNPNTPLNTIIKILDKVDLVLIMSVNPGFGAQSFIPEVIPKIREISQIIKRENLKLLLEVDGGINFTTVKEVLKAGANLIVAGSSIYHSKEPENTIKKYLEIFKEYQ